MWLLLAVLLPLVAVGAILWLLFATLVQVVVWVTWCPRGRYALVVYSDSPIWREYFEQAVLPALGSRAVVLNWSQRKRWRLSLPVMLFKLFAGSRDFNPIALVFEPFSWAERFRFYKAFRAFKHGRADEVEAVRLEFLTRLDGLAPLDAA